MRRFKVTSGIGKKFIYVSMLVDDLEERFGILSLRTNISVGFFKVTAFITIYGDDSRIEEWWKVADKSGKYFKIEEIILKEEEVKNGG
ncbi:hypothetical protein A2Z67_04965 [Candidatus Woesebacteria bacterium RBG_13_36_22]|uniref:Uncharacterized protein n=1 Tax=Candidatus Woesebacteria bacterium RBG_13_36_22 TaxID=1802478 RepID=A0A1F7X2F1_9BACT|nr:MAG: hypothetical protein A2Z67_04965 [Candidatus Woesebacteria bacterium RBG_13_36_22]